MCHNILHFLLNVIKIQDDPLSALDVHVGGHLFEEGIMDFLIENKRTVILVTHQIQYLDKADQVSQSKKIILIPHTSYNFYK